MIHDIFMRFPGGRAKAFTLSYDDGTVFDKRLIELFNKYNVKATFNLNSQRMIDSDENISVNGRRRRIGTNEYAELIKNTDHEIAVHTCNHPSLGTLPIASQVLEIINDRKNLEKFFGKIIRGMAYPNGTWAVSDKTVEAVKAAQIEYARLTDPSHNFDLPENPLLLHPTCHHNDGKVFDLIDEFLNAQVERYANMFYLWGHSYEFDEKDNWEQIENILKKISGKDDVWYATNIEIIDYINAYKNLKFDVELNTVYNPTATKLCFTYDYKKLITVNPGETLKID